jgi:hypothetical protein
LFAFLIFPYVLHILPIKTPYFIILIIFQILKALII